MSTPVGAVQAANPQKGVKRSVPGNPTHVPGQLPGFRGRDVDAGAAVKAPKLRNGNLNNETSNVRAFAFAPPTLGVRAHSALRARRYAFRTLGFARSNSSRATRAGSGPATSCSPTSFRRASSRRAPTSTTRRSA